MEKTGVYMEITDTPAYKSTESYKPAYKFSNKKDRLSTVYETEDNVVDEANDNVLSRCSVKVRALPRWMYSMFKQRDHGAIHPSIEQEPSESKQSEDKRSLLR